MEFRSLADLTRITRTGAETLGDDFDLIVGVPRSGMLPATIIALLKNKPLLDLPSFLRGDIPENGLTRILDGGQRQAIEDFQNILVVEDSLSSGRSLQSVRSRINAARPDARVTYLAVIAAPETRHLADLNFDLCEHPRFFEWNLMNGQMCDRALFDLDGVFCRDPSQVENDDGEAYRAFIQTVAVTHRPRQPIRGIVTSRLDMYRPETEAWLSAQGIRCERLEMMTGVTAQERREKRLHAPFKARLYARDPGAELFVESDPGQSLEIARLSGKPVLDFSSMILIQPDAGSLAYARQILACGARRQRRTMGGLLSRLRSFIPFAR
ncbi:phosphoribosyltransferase family protein [Pseudophaeobacter sp. 1A16562]